MVWVIADATINQKLLSYHIWQNKISCQQKKISHANNSKLNTNVIANMWWQVKSLRSELYADHHDLRSSFQDHFWTKIPCSKAEPKMSQYSRNKIKAWCKEHFATPLNYESIVTDVATESIPQHTLMEYLSLTPTLVLKVARGDIIARLRDQMAHQLESTKWGFRTGT